MSEEVVRAPADPYRCVGCGCELPSRCFPCSHGPCGPWRIRLIRGTTIGTDPRSLLKPVIIRRSGFEFDATAAEARQLAQLLADAAETAERGDASEPRGAELAEPRRCTDCGCQLGWDRLVSSCESCVEQRYEQLAASGRPSRISLVPRASVAADQLSPQPLIVLRLLGFEFFANIDEARAFAQTFIDAIETAERGDASEHRHAVVDEVRFKPRTVHSDEPEAQQ